MYDPNTSGPFSRSAPNPADEPEPSISARTCMQKLRTEAGATLAGIPRALKLVWQSHRGYTIGMVFFSVIFGFLPAITAWVGKLLIDAVVAAMILPEDLKAFDLDGYYFNPGLSDDHDWYFTR